MPQFTIIFGILLILLGTVGFVLTGHTHLTALIPALIGLLLTALGMVAKKPTLRKHTMHAAIVVALIGLLGALSRLRHLFGLFRGENIHFSSAQIASGLMAVLCLSYIVIALGSFVRARTRNRSK